MLMRCKICKIREFWKFVKFECSIICILNSEQTRQSRSGWSAEPADPLLHEHDRLSNFSQWISASRCSQPDTCRRTQQAQQAWCARVVWVSYKQWPVSASSLDRFLQDRQDELPHWPASAARRHRSSHDTASPRLYRPVNRTADNVHTLLVYY